MKEYHIKVSYYNKEDSIEKTDAMDNTSAFMNILNALDDSNKGEVTDLRLVLVTNKLIK